jgi:hypothetical protein
LGHLIAAQLRNHLEERVTGGEVFFMSDVTGRYLQEALFGPGEIPKDRKLKWGGPLQEEHLEYATDDVAHLKELYAALREVLREHGVEERYEAISSRLPDFIGAAVRGVPLDTATLQPALDALEREKGDLESRLNELAPEHPDGLEWVWGNTSKETSPDGKGRNGALRALSLVGVELPDLQDQTLLGHREDHELVHTLTSTARRRTP